MKIEQLLSHEHKRYQAISVPAASLSAVRNNMLSFATIHPHKSSKRYLPRLAVAWIGVVVLVILIGIAMQLRSHNSKTSYTMKRMFEEIQVATMREAPDKIALRRKVVAARFVDLSQALETDDTEISQAAFDEAKQAIYTLLAQVPQDRLQTEIDTIIAMLDATASIVPVDSVLYQQIQQLKTELTQYLLEKNVQAAVAPSIEAPIVAATPQPTSMVTSIPSTTPSSTDNHEGNKDKEKNKDKGRGSENKSDKANKK